MSNYFILTDIRVKPKFDALVRGILLNNNHEIIANPFNNLEDIKEGSKYFMKVVDKESETGKLRDKLSVTIQNDESLLVVNLKAQEVLKKFCTNIDFYDLTFVQNNKLNQDYKIVNIKNSVDCINHEDSKLLYWEESHEIVYNIDELKINEESIPADLNIFLLGETRGGVIVIHNRLREAILENQITGFNFCELDDFVL